ERELEMARSIQARLLPPPTMSGEGFSLEARNMAAHYVAGDFYDFIRLDDGSIVIVVADVAGKGMGASLTMASVKAVLPFVARGGADGECVILSCVDSEGSTEPPRMLCHGHSSRRRAP